MKRSENKKANSGTQNFYTEWWWSTMTQLMIHCTRANYKMLPGEKVEPSVLLTKQRNPTTKIDEKNSFSHVIYIM